MARRQSNDFRTVTRPTIGAAAEANATGGGTIAAGRAWNHRPDATSPVPKPAEARGEPSQQGSDNDDSQRCEIKRSAEHQVLAIRAAGRAQAIDQDVAYVLGESRVGRS